MAAWYGRRLCICLRINYLTTLIINQANIVSPYGCFVICLCVWLRVCARNKWTIRSAGRPVGRSVRGLFLSTQKKVATQIPNNGRKVYNRCGGDEEAEREPTKKKGGCERTVFIMVNGLSEWLGVDVRGRRGGGRLVMEKARTKQAKRDQMGGWWLLR